MLCCISTFQIQNPNTPVTRHLAITCKLCLVLTKSFIPRLNLTTHTQHAGARDRLRSLLSQQD